MFITIEGIDGSGKSTQAKKLSEWLELHTGRRTIRTAEPYILRDLILNGEKLCTKADLLLFLADRAQHVHDVILPAIRADENIICERYNESTLAYQSDVLVLNDLIALCDFPEPDVKILLDLSPEIAVSRIKSRKTHDKFEAQGLELMRRVSENYRALNLTRIICDDLNEEEIFTRILECVQCR